MRIVIISFLLSILVSASCLALTPNLPAGTLGSGTTVNTRFGDIPDGVRYQPAPVLPAEAHRLSGRGLYEVDVDVARGLANNVRVLQSCGSKILDDAAIAALMKWRFVPRSFYKLTVPIEFQPSGRIRIGP